MGGHRPPIGSVADAATAALGGAGTGIVPV